MFVCPTCSIEYKCCKVCSVKKCPTCGNDLLTNNKYKMWKLDNLLMVYVYGFGIFDISQSQHILLNTGSATLVDTASIKLIVTASHVIEEYHKLQKERGVEAIALCLLGNGSTYAIEDSDLVDCKDENGVDLATIAVPESIKLEEHGYQFYRSLNWPPKRVEKNDFVLALGYAKDAQSRLTSSVKLRTTSKFEHVESVSEFRFTISSEGAKQMKTQYTEHKGIGSDFTGGMSGGAIFRVNESLDEGNIDLVGIITDGPRSGWEYLFGCHLDLISKDGTIRTYV